MEFDKIIMLIIAILLDLFGLLCFILSFFGVGIAISFLPDLIGGFTIGPWSLLKKGGGVKGIAKGLGKKALKFIIAQITELIPFLGDIAPSWTILVLTS